MTAGSRDTSLAEDTIAAFNTKVADPAFFCGGGSVAAITLSNAAALTLLVMQLNARRKKNRSYSIAIERQICAVESIRDQLYASADKDLDVLDSLLRAQRLMKETGRRDAYQSALIKASESPYEICGLGFTLLETIEGQLPLATRFTVSDLGAAAALALGAIQGAILTTDVNVALLRDEPGADQDHIERIDADALEIVRGANAIAERIRSFTIAVIRQTADGRVV